MGKITGLDFESIRRNLSVVREMNYVELTRLCDPPDSIRIPREFAEILGHSEKESIFREFLALRPAKWAWILRNFRPDSLRNLVDISAELPVNVSARPAILVIPHFSIHMMVPFILEELLGLRLVAIGAEESSELMNCVRAVKPMLTCKLIPIPDPLVLFRLVSEMKHSWIPVIFPEVSVSRERRPFYSTFLGRRVVLPMGVEALARLTSANVVPVAMLETDTNRYTILNGPKLLFKGEGSIVQPLFNWIEKLVCTYPTQWYGWRFFGEMLAGN